MASSLAALGLPLFAGPAGAAWDPFFAPVTQVAEIDGAIANDRPWGLAAGEFDATPGADLVVIRFDGTAVYFVHGNGNGTFGTPTPLGWRVGSGNGNGLAAGDVNGDGNLDVVWGTTADAAAGAILDGQVRAWLGNGNGTFQTNNVVVSGLTYNLGVLLGDIGADAAALAIGDVDGDGDKDVAAGGINGTNAVVNLFRNDGGAPPAFTMSTLVSSVAGANATGVPVYYPPTTTAAVTSPWGLALGDADGDADLDLFVADRALYVYLFRGDNTGAFTLQTGNGAVSGRPNVYLGHDSFRAAVGFSTSMSAGDVNGDGKADLAMGLQLGTNTPATSPAPAHDGEIVLDLSTGTGHALFGSIGDVGTMARGLAMIDVNLDGARDIVAGEYTGKIQLLRQLPPLDGDGDGVSDYVDNAPAVPNAPRIDMNADATTTYLDQLDNDFDTVLGNPEDSGTWQRNGDAVDPDDDNDGVLDGADNCAFTANADQADIDGDTVGDGCDPLDDRDPDGDGVPNGYLPGSPLYEEAKAAAAKWSTGDTHFVIRIDALGRFFQDEFTRIMTDAASLSPADWAAKCWEDYDPGDIAGDPAYEPCGDDATKTLTLPGGKDVPVSVVVIPKQLWSDPPVVAWVNDRNDSANLEIGQHGSYHDSNTGAGTWAGDPQKDFYSCESCGLTEAESFERFKVGQDTLLGNYASPWIAQSGATGASPKIDWSTSANPLITYSPPFNASDTLSRKAVAQLGYKAFSASVFEENNGFFTPEGSHQDDFDQFGMFHASADIELDPPDTTGDTYDTAAYAGYLASQTQSGGLTTWLIEEVEWSGRPCQNDDRLGTCNGGSNRENNTVYAPRWNGWMQLLDYVRGYPGGVAMTMGEVALAKGFDNAPSVANADQADADHDGIGDVADGSLDVLAQALTRNAAGALTATLVDANGAGMAGQTVSFAFDADGDTVDEVFTDVTDASGVASVSVTATRPVGVAWVSASWTGDLGATASGSATVGVTDSTVLTLDVANPASGQATDTVVVSATLVDSDSAPLPGKQVAFTIGSASASGFVDIDGHASATVTLGPSGSTELVASFAGDEVYGATTSAPQAFTVAAEDTLLALDPANPTSAYASDGVSLSATLTEDGGPVPGRTLTFSIGSASATGVTDSAGVATAVVVPVGPAGAQAVSAAFDGDAVYAASSASDAISVSSEATSMALDPGNPVSGAALSTASVGATLSDDDGAPVVGRTVTFSIGSSSQAAVTDTAGHAAATLSLLDGAGPYSLAAVFAGDDSYDPSSASSPFTVVTATSVLSLDAANPTSGAIDTTATFGATLTDSSGGPLAGRLVTFTVGTASASGTTDAAGHASAGVLLAAPAGPTTVSADWTGDTTYASANTTAPFAVLSETTAVVLDAANPSSGQYTDAVTVGATLIDSMGSPLPGQTVRFTIDGFFANGVTDSSGHASASLTLTAAPGAYALTAAYAGTADFTPSSAAHPFAIGKEGSAILLPSVADPAGSATVQATLVDVDSGAGVAGRTVRLYIAIVKRGTTSWKLLGSGSTNSAGTATIVVSSRNMPSSPSTMKATFGGDKFFLGSEATATLSR